MESKKGFTIPGKLLGLIIALIFCVIAALIIFISKGWSIDLIAHMRGILRLV